MTKTPKYTPWGPSEVTHVVADGVAFVTTASRGGYWLSDDRLAKVPNHWRLARFHPSSDSSWFEEDCDWAIVAFFLPELFTPDEAKAADSTLDNWHPDVKALRW